VAESMPKIGRGAASLYDEERLALAELLREVRLAVAMLDKRYERKW
jgi:hypothetical protein